MRKTSIMLFLLLGLGASEALIAQDTRFGKISEEELQEKSYAPDPNAAAAVLFRKVALSFNYRQGQGFEVITNVHERIKIYTKEGFDHATISERLYRDGKDGETLTSLRAITYNLKSGKITEDKLKNSEVFKSTINKYYDAEKFTLPNVQEGSVIEYEYRLNSPFYYSLDEIALQYDIPIKQQEISLAIPEYFYFKPNMKGYLPVTPIYSSSRAKIVFNSKQRSRNSFGSTPTTFTNSSIDYQVNKTLFKMDMVPALKEEPYVNDMDNYRSAVNYELQYTQFPNSTRDDYTGTWEKVIKTIYDSQDFGDQLSRTKYFRDDLKLLLAKKNSAMEKANAIFEFVQQRMSWNGYLGYFTDKGVKDAYAERTGNIADINLMLTAMFKEAGLEAAPVLISTRDHGVPIFPTMEGFNYVVASVAIDGTVILFDATNKYTEPGLLPPMALNWFGRIIKEDRTFTPISVFPTVLSSENLMMNIAMETNGSIKGKIRNICTKYRAYSFRNAYDGMEREDYIEKLENDNNGLIVSDYSVEGVKTLGKPIKEDFLFVLEDQADVIGSNIYFSPLFHKTLTSSPFKLDKRNYPIDFIYPRQNRYVVTINIPEGYEVTSKPSDVMMVLRNDMGSFVYKIVEGTANLQVLVDFKLKAAVLPAEHYAEVKQLYKKIVEKEMEKVVLSKIVSDGDKDSATGSR